VISPLASVADRTEPAEGARLDGRPLLRAGMPLALISHL
jgi:hypothetical protein